MQLIGLTGELAAVRPLHIPHYIYSLSQDGTFSRLGLLQAPRPGEPCSALSEYSFAQKTLWHARASSIPVHNEPLNQPIWQHPSITIHPLTRIGKFSIYDIPSDMRTHQLLQWGRSPQQLKSLTCINAIEVQGGTVSCRDYQNKPTYDIIGLRPGYPPHRSLPVSIAPQPEHVGTIDPVPAMYGIERWGNMADMVGLEIYQDFQKFDARFVNTFTVNGAGGEIISSVSISENMRSIKLATNRGRSKIFGHVESRRHNYNWLSYEAKEGEVIVGLSTSFAELSGWSHGAKMSSHWRLSDLGVMLQSVDENGNWRH